MKETARHIAIIGTGQLGSRHLQGLSLTNMKIAIYVIDPDRNALENSRKLFNEMPKNPKVSSVRYNYNLNHLKHKLDVAIVATSADVRRKVIENLLRKTDVRYFILEKVVFQSIHDFEEVINLLELRGIKAWVNCPRRIFPFFRELKKETRKSKKVFISVRGCNWGMACNSIHLLDLLAFLTGQSKFTLNAKNLNKDLFESKRKGFMEIGGRLVANSERGDKLEMIDLRPKGTPFKFLINYDGQKIELDQSSGWITKQSQHSQNKSYKKKFKFPMQSEITSNQVEEILLTGNSQLTSLKESYELHKPMIDAFNKHFSVALNKPVKVCPIT